jgi:hypothetical protein
LSGAGFYSPDFSPSHRVCWTNASTCEKSGLASGGVLMNSGRRMKGLAIHDPPLFVPKPRSGL